MLVDVADKIAKGIPIGIFGLILSAHDDGLEVLGAQQSAHAPPASGAGVFLTALHDAGDRDQVLPGKADAGQLGSGVGLLAELLKGRKMILPPEVVRGADLDLAIVDPEVDGPGSPAGDDEPIKAGGAQFGPPVATHVGLVPDAGQGRAPAPGAAAAGWRKGASQQAIEGQQGAGRIEGIEVGIHLLVIDFGCEATAQEITPHVSFGDGLDLMCSVGQVDSQQLSCIDVGHFLPPLPCAFDG